MSADLDDTGAAEAMAADAAEVVSGLGYAVERDGAWVLVTR